MFQKIPASQRHFSDMGWLKTYWLFSFDFYYDVNNIHFGNLRVFNDDVIAANSGFPTHPHREMEIVTIIHSGILTHKDNIGNIQNLEEDEVQRMSAGTLITHSEYNHQTAPIHLYQIWFIPHTRGLKPSYEQRKFPKELRKNTLLPVAVGDQMITEIQQKVEPVTIYSNAVIYLADWDKNFEMRYRKAHPKTEKEKERGFFLYVTSGELQVNDHLLLENDQLRVTQEAEIELLASKDTKFILIDVER